MTGSPEIDEHAPRRDRPPAPDWAGPVAGLVAGWLAVAVGVVVAAVFDLVSPYDAVGSEVIDRVPAWLKDLAIDWFGTADKLALRIGIAVVLVVAGWWVGRLARRRAWVGDVGIALFGLIGALAAADRADASWAAGIPPLVGAAVGIVVLRYLLAIVRRHDGATERPGPSRIPDGWDRRRFLVTSGVATAGAAVAAASARELEDRRIERLRDAAPDTLPTPATTPTGSTPPPIEVPPGAQLSPITPFVTPNDEFYLIDTALSVPRIRLDRWRVEVGGMVDRPLTLSYDDLLALPQVERMITLSCVSNEVGGTLVGNAVWQGVLLADVLADARVDPAAEQVFSTSTDGWTCGFPIGAALDGRGAMIALGMNGEPLPLRHGFPARLVVPGLYGYVSATKWLSSIEVTTWADETGYWVPRGWSREGPIKTQSRIDVPRRNEEVPAGRIAIAGVAWAPTKGIDRVEVQIDDGPWLEARLGDEVTDDAWRQWVHEWDAATPGEHVVKVRATDGTGETQTAEVSRPDPDGATGHHTRRFTVIA